MYGLTFDAQVVIVKNELPVKTMDEFVALTEKDSASSRSTTTTAPATAAPSCFASWPRSTFWACPTKPAAAITDLIDGRIDIIFSDYRARVPDDLDGPRTWHRS